MIDLLFGIVFMFGGALLGICAVKNYDWIFTTVKIKRIVDIFGRKIARVICFICSVIVTLGGLSMVFGSFNN